MAGGNFQEPGIDFKETYAPVIDFSLVRTCIVLATIHSWSTRHIDITAAFLNGDVDSRIVVTSPVNLPRFMRQSDIFLLLKSLYGLRQAPLLWYKKLVSVLEELKFKKINSNESIMVRLDEKGENIQLIVAIYVDDLIFFATNDEILELVVQELLKVFQGNDLGTVSWYLSVSISTSEGVCAMSQTAYIDELAQLYKLKESNPVYTPMSNSFYSDQRAHANDPEITDEHYRHIIGSLLYLSTRTRPDVACAVGILSQYVSRPTNFLLQAAKRVLIYLWHTRKFVLSFSNIERDCDIMEMWVDADHAGDQKDRKSRTGYCATMGGGAISWCSQKQRSVALSTAEAEYMAISEATKEVMWLRMFFKEIGQERDGPTTLLNDNGTAQGWVDGTAGMRRAKHIETRYHFAKDCFVKGFIQPKHIPGSVNIADGFTKPLNRVAFERFRDMVGVKPI